MEELLTSPSNVSLDVFLTKMIDLGISVGSKILLAIVVFIVGRWIVRRLNKLLAKILEKRHVEASLSTFVKSLVNITLTLLLIIVVIGGVGYRDQFVYSLVCICRCCHWYGIERYVTEFCRRGDDFVVQAV